MIKREQLLMIIILVVIAVCSAAAIFFVMEKAKPSNIRNLSTRFVDFSEMCFSASQGNVEASTEAMRIEWLDTSAQEILFTSSPQPFSTGKTNKLQADMLIGGSKNTDIQASDGDYRVWLEFVLLLDGNRQNTQRIEILLDSERA